MTPTWFNTSIFIFLLLFSWGCGPNNAAKVETTNAGIKVILPGDVKMAFVEIPAGNFMMGSPETEKDRDDDEGPQREVALSRPFYLGQYEVTQKQWAALMGANPSKFQNPDHPVDSVLWEQCQRFIEKLNTLNAGKFRLPSEAEWEYACRAGTTTRYYWSDDLNFVEMLGYAWFDNNSANSTHPVGLKKPNPWGLYDMNGNVNEWCQDYYAPYPSGPQTDPLAQEGSTRIKRGGGFYDFAWNARSAARNPETDPSSLELLGFRVVREKE